MFDRCGAMDVPYDGKIAEFTGEFVEIGGEQIPLMNFHFQMGTKFTRHLCLRTWLGYIPVENIECFKDIFNKNKYLHDYTEWVKPYDGECASEYDRGKVRQLSTTLGKHWKP